MSSLAVVILAAGKGTRMKSTLPKVLHKVGGHTMLNHVLNAAEAAKPEHIVVVTGFGAEKVEEHVNDVCPKAVCVRQTEQNGTGHAVMQTKEALKNFNGTTVVLYGDVLAVTGDMIQDLHQNHLSGDNAISMLTATTDEMEGLGRIIRGKDGHFQEIIEHKDCTEEQLQINEINLGTFMLDNQLMFSLLGEINTDNAQGELYLTDIIGIAQSRNLTLEATAEYAPKPLLGVNSRAEQAAAEAVLQDMWADEFMAAGVTLTDPSTVFFSADTQIENDTIIGPNVRFGTNVTVKSGVTIEGDCHITNTTIGTDTTVYAFSHMDGANIGENNKIGPFARLRPNADIKNNVKIGNFVEVKKSTIGDKSSVGHFTYVGNAEIGEQVNIGAFTSFANYHHFKKEKNTSHIGDGASIGSHNCIVAPTKVGANAFTGAGTTVRKDVPEGALRADKSDEIIKENYSKKFKS